MINKKTLLITIIIFICIIIICIALLLKKPSHNEETYKDTTAPIIVLNDTYPIKKGYDKNLLDVIVSADDTDSSPTREIIGDYDVNIVGDYNLTYRITDRSGNSTQKDFILKVKDDVSYKEDELKFSDTVKKHKTDTTKIGIDVSKWQKDIDWKKVAGENVEFAFLRMAYQNGFDGDLIIDPYFEQNVNGCIENNIPIAVYFSSYSKTIEEAEKQAEWIIKYLQENNYTNLTVAFDWENWASFNKLNLSINEINEMANIFMDAINNSNYKAMLYGSKTYLESIWQNNKNYPVWLANYVSQTEYQNEYKIWQLTQKGKISGISGYVDINIMY